MNRYKRSIRVRRDVQIILAILAPVLILGIGFCQMKFSIEPVAMGVWLDKNMGFLIGIEVVCLYRIIRSHRLLKDEERMETAYIEEMDERNRMVQLRSARMCLGIMIFLLSYGAILASFIDDTVFMTLGVSLIVLLIVYLGVYLYYNRKL